MRPKESVEHRKGRDRITDHAVRVGLVLEKQPEKGLDEDDAEPHQNDGRARQERGLHEDGGVMEPVDHECGPLLRR